MKNWDSLHSMTVTPQIAKTWLEGAANFRKPDKNLVSSIANAMEFGDYVDNGDPIRISPQGVCVDGQHRLLGVIRSGMPISMTVMTGFTGDILFVDSNRKQRTVGDYLAQKGVKNARRAASVARCHLGVLDYGTEFMSGTKAFVTHRHDEVVAQYLKDPEMYDRALAIGSKDAMRYLAVSRVGTLYILFSSKDQEMADDFFECFSLDVVRRLDGSDTFNRLLSRLMMDKMNRSSRLDTPVKVALFIKTWNCWRNGSSLKNLRWRGSGLHREVFPVIL